MDEMTDDVWEGSGVVQLEEVDQNEPSDLKSVGCSLSPCAPWVDGTLVCMVSDLLYEST